MEIESKTYRKRLIDFFLLPSSYPYIPDSVRHLQTHASDVFIAPPYVYKIKKPVDLGFLDFSTLEKRKYYCENEVKLNRRLCGDTYIGVVQISESDGQLHYGEGQNIVEYAVKMKLLAEERFLKHLLPRGEVSKNDFTRLAQKLVKFYNSQKEDQGISSFGDPRKVKLILEDNLSFVKGFIGKTISPVSFEAISFYNKTLFDKKSKVLDQRVKDGFIKDCHGDLHLEHINLRDEGICIYDCIEFNERFRYIDIASDVAFLAMDLDYNGYWEYSEFFISEISRLTGDDTIYEVIDLYKCYRAFVRGKVESIRGNDPSVPKIERESARRRAGKYFELALRYALFGSRPVILVTFGVIGSGKSTIANELSEELGCAAVSSDIVRKELTGTVSTERKYEGYDQGIYSDDVTRTTYNELISRGREEIEKNKMVILDASFSKRKWRDMVMEKLGEYADVLYVNTVADIGEIKTRLHLRECAGDSVSDGRIEILDRFIKEFEKPEKDETTNLITVNTEANRESLLDSVFVDIMLNNFRTETGDKENRKQ